MLLGLGNRFWDQLKKSDQHIFDADMVLVTEWLWSVASSLKVPDSIPDGVNFMIVPILTK